MKRILLQNRKNGFTMVETLVAISILLVVIIGPMTIAQKGIQNAYFARDQLTAVFLAQEAIEAVRELRDNQGLIVYNQLIQGDSTSFKTWDWYDDFVTDKPKHSEECLTVGCGFDPLARSFRPCSDIELCKLRIKDGEYMYVAGEGDSSIFTRKVYIEDHGTAVKVTVVVEWNATAFAGARREVKLETWMYDRYKHYES